MVERKICEKLIDDHRRTMEFIIKNLRIAFRDGAITEKQLTEQEEEIRKVHERYAEKLLKVWEAEHGNN